MENYDALKAKLSETIAREKKLYAKADELSDFVENASLPLHWVNGSGIVIWVNQAELDLLGYTKEEYLNKHISNFHVDNEVIEDILTRLMNKETILNYPARLKCKNGDIKHVLINSNVLWKNNEFIHTRCFTRDITEIKLEIERQQEIIQSFEKEKGELEDEISRLKDLLSDSQ